MTATLFVIAAVVAVGDWLAVWQRFFRIEYALKPLTLALLIAATASADLPDTKPWVLGALVLSLAGDVALMLSDENRTLDSRFLLGLAAFLAAHVAYLVAFGRYGIDGLQIVAGLLIVVGAAALTLPKVLTAARRTGGDELMAVLAAYAAVLGAMAVMAVGTASILTAVGGVAFLASDTILARDRFVAPVRNGALLVMVTYHLAQFLIVLGLVS